MGLAALLSEHLRLAFRPLLAGGFHGAMTVG